MSEREKNPWILIMNFRVLKLSNDIIVPLLTKFKLT